MSVATKESSLLCVLRCLYLNKEAAPNCSLLCVTFSLVLGPRVFPAVSVGTEFTDRYLGSRGHICPRSLRIASSFRGFNCTEDQQEQVDLKSIRVLGLAPRPSPSRSDTPQPYGPLATDINNGNTKNEPISKTRQTALPRASGPLQRHLDSLVWLSQVGANKAAKGPSSPEEPLSSASY